MKPFTLDEAIAYANEIAKAWRTEERNAAMVGNIKHAVKCHQSAIVLEQFVYDCQQQMAARNAA